MKFYIKWALGCSAIAATICLANVQTVVSQADITGTNTWNSTTPIFEIESQLDPETLARAQELSQALNDAYSDCLASVDNVSNLPRRFSRRSENSDRICISADCAKYNRLLDRTKQFLTQIDIPEEDRLRAIQNLRTW